MDESKELKNDSNDESEDSNVEPAFCGQDFPMEDSKTIDSPDLKESGVLPREMSSIFQEACSNSPFSLFKMESHKEKGMLDKFDFSDPASNKDAREDNSECSHSEEFNELIRKITAEMLARDLLKQKIDSNDKPSSIDDKNLTATEPILEETLKCSNEMKDKLKNKTKIDFKSQCDDTYKKYINQNPEFAYLIQKENVQKFKKSNNSQAEANCSQINKEENYPKEPKMYTEADFKSRLEHQKLKNDVDLLARTSYLRKATEEWKEENQQNLQKKGLLLKESEAAINTLKSELNDGLNWKIRFNRMKEIYHEKKIGIEFEKLSRLDTLKKREDSLISNIIEQEQHMDLFENEKSKGLKLRDELVINYGSIKNDEKDYIKCTNTANKEFKEAKNELENVKLCQQKEKEMLLKALKKVEISTSIMEANLVEQDKNKEKLKSVLKVLKEKSKTKKDV